MPTIRQVYKEALAPIYGLEEMTIRFLLMEANGFLTMTELLSKMDEPMHGFLEYQRLFARVINGEPVQYVLQKTTFFGLDLFVDSRVLIPRFETEELVEKILLDQKTITTSHHRVIADIGTGSGCIAFALERHIPDSQVLAVDSSFDALEVAEINKTKLKSKVRFFQGHLLDPLLNQKIRLDLLVSNPPYIENAAEVERKVLDFEPHAALFAPHGIDHYVSMISMAPLVMMDQGRIYFEINYDQEEALGKVVQDYLPFSSYQFLKDMQGKTRFLFIIFKKGPQANL